MAGLLCRLKRVFLRRLFDHILLRLSQIMPAVFLVPARLCPGAWLTDFPAVVVPSIERAIACRKLPMNTAIELIRATIPDTAIAASVDTTCMLHLFLSGNATSALPRPGGYRMNSER